MVEPTGIPQLHTVKELMHLLKRSEVDQEAVQAAIDHQVTADQLLVNFQLDDPADPGYNAGDSNRQAKVDRDLAKAREELAKGDAARNDAEPDEAIQHYGKPWMHAIHAAKEAAKGG